VIKIVPRAQALATDGWSLVTERDTMTTTIWSKFFWADWLADTNLRRCSPAARGLWMDMLCLAAQASPYGYLAKDGAPLDTARLARNVSMSEGDVVALVAELENEHVFSRDRHGRIYSRRMVREAKLRKAAQASGKRGGNPSLCAAREIRRTLKGRDKGPVAPISQKPESISQEPDSAAAADARAERGWQGTQALIERAAAAMRVPVAALRRRTGWLVFGDMMAHLAAQGCDVERDIWPTIERLSARLAEPPVTPQYFRAAILDARDRRLAGGTVCATTHVEWQDRLAVFAREGVWSSRWGPKPGEAGCLAPSGQLAKTSDPVRVSDDTSMQSDATKVA
jgi:hypothetical protein